MAVTSRGFDWANYKFEAVSFVGSPRAAADNQSEPQARRAKKKKSGVDDDATEGGDAADSCSGWDGLRSEVDSVITCILCLVAVWFMRSLVCYVVQHALHRPISDDLRFPAWEVCLCFCVCLCCSPEE